MGSPINERPAELKIAEKALENNPSALSKTKEKIVDEATNTKIKESDLFSKKVARGPTENKYETIQASTKDDNAQKTTSNWLKERIKKDPVLADIIKVNIATKSHKQNVSANRALNQVIENPAIKQAAMNYLLDQFKQKNYVESRGEKPNNAYKMAPTVFLNPVLFEQKKVPQKEADINAEILLRKSQIKEAKKLLDELASMEPSYAKSKSKDLEQFIGFAIGRIQNINLVKEIHDLENILKKGDFSQEEVNLVKAMISSKQDILQAMTSGFYNIKQISGKGVAGMGQFRLNVTTGSLLEKKDEISRLNFELFQAKKTLKTSANLSKMEFLQLENQTLKLEASLLKKQSEMQKIEETINNGTYNKIFENSEIKRELDRKSEHLRVLDGTVQIQLHKLLNQSAKKINQMEFGKPNLKEKAKDFFKNPPKTT